MIVIIKRAAQESFVAGGGGGGDFLKLLVERVARYLKQLLPTFF